MDARMRYPSDLTDAQWCNIEELFPRPEGPKSGRPRTYPVREIVNAVFYLARSGCAWRMLPHDFPPWKTVSYSSTPGGTPASGSGCTTSCGWTCGSSTAASRHPAPVSSTASR